MVCQYVQKAWEDWESFLLEGRVGGVVLDGSKGVGNVGTGVDVLVVCLRGGSDEFRCQMKVRAGSNAELSGPIAVMRAAKNSTMIALATMLMRGSWSAVGRTPGWPPCGGGVWSRMPSAHT